MNKPTGAPAQPVHELSESRRLSDDMAMHADKLAGGPDRRNFEAAMRLQMARQDAAGGVL